MLLDVRRVRSYFCQSFGIKPGRCNQRRCSNSRQERSFGAVGCGRCCRFLLRMCKSEGDRFLLAYFQTIKTVHTAAVIDLAGFTVNAVSLAFCFTLSTVVAGAFVDPDFHRGKPGNKTQDRSNRTDGVAIGSSITPG